jgi:cis-3-alkyl-4-acyloxetan-2-one decarboxylase
MRSFTLTLQGVEVFVEGDGSDTLVLLHGWPDTHRVWDGTVEALKHHFRCVRFTLPGYDLAKPPRATSLAEMTALIAGIVDAVSPAAPVTLVLHDWGCVFGYEFATRCPQRVARIVAVDIGDHNSGACARSLSFKAKARVFAYQFWLAVAWTVGGTVGTAMTRWMARRSGSRVASSAVGWQMNYPYAMRWFGLLGGFRGAAPVAHRCPVLFIYGLRKPFMFQSPEWLLRLAERPGCAVQPFPTGHWVMAQQPEAFNRCVATWLAGQRAAVTESH